MNNEQKETLICILCLLLGATSYFLVIWWYIGLACAVGAVALAFYHDRHYDTKRVVLVGMWLGLAYIGMLILIGLFILGYFHMLHVQL